MDESSRLAFDHYLFFIRRGMPSFEDRARRLADGNDEFLKSVDGAVIEGYHTRLDTWLELIRSGDTQYRRWALGLICGPKYMRDRIFEYANASIVGELAKRNKITST
jgi:hypothetical protein